jgi:hypothetical protein
MRYLIFGCLGLAVLFAIVANAQPTFTITIDATALSPQQNMGVHHVVNYTSDVVQSLELAPGVYTSAGGVGNNSSFKFTVSETGTVDYSTDFDGFLAGRGTSTLVINGFDVSIDATALAPQQNMGVHHISTYTSNVVQNYTLVPGIYTSAGGAGNNSAFNVTLDEDGNWTYVPGHEDFLDGSGTSALVITGFDVSIDATALAPQQNMGVHHIVSYTSNVVQNLTLVPGIYTSAGGNGNHTAFNVTLDQDGKWTYLPGVDGFLSGAGTDTLVIDGYAVSADATGLTPQNMGLIAIQSFHSSVAASWTLVPGLYRIVGGPGNNATFDVTLGNGGHWTYGSGFEDFLSGAGSAVLVVDGFQCFIDARELHDQALSAYFGLLFIDSAPGRSTDTVQEYSILPGLYRLDVPTPWPGSNFLFNVDNDGLAQNLPPSHLGIPVTGAGTNTLLIGNEPPVPDAGDNFSIMSQEQSATVIAATATDPEGDAMTYRWYEVTGGGDVLLTGPTPVSGGQTPLDLGVLAPLAIGDHTFRLEVADAYGCASDTVTVTVDNTPPVAGPAGGGTYCTANPLVTLSGEVSDYDGDSLTVEWQMNGDVLFSEVVTPPFGGASLDVTDRSIATNDIGVGLHTIYMVVDDGTNTAVSASIEVEIVVDTTPPTLAPKPSTTILWPPNHKLVDVIVMANAKDNCDGSPVISVVVSSSEPAEYDGDGNTIPDWEVVSIDQATGAIALRLRSERSGKGDGRVYSIAVTATDASNNSSTSITTVRAPHNKRR